jgi:hypothetical protein
MVTVGVIAVFQRRSYTDLHNGLLGLFLAQSLVLIVTDSIKVFHVFILPTTNLAILSLHLYICPLAM